MIFLFPFQFFRYLLNIIYGKLNNLIFVKIRKIWGGFIEVDLTLITEKRYIHIKFRI